MGRPRCFLGRLWALVPVLAAGSEPGPEGSCRFPLCLAHSLLSLSLHQTLVFQHPPSFFSFLHSSFDPRLPSPPSFPQAPRSNLPSRSPRLFSPLLPTCLLVGPPPSAFPGPARAPHAKASRKSLGQAAHSPPRASWPGPSSSCLQRDLPHGSLSPCPLQEWRGPRGDKGQRPLLSLPFASSSNRTSRDAARRVTAWRGTAGRWHPEWGGPEGCSKGHQSSAQRGAGSVPEGHILEGSSP